MILVQVLADEEEEMITASDDEEEIYLMVAILTFTKRKLNRNSCHTKPFVGCVEVALPGDQSHTGNDLQGGGSYGTYSPRKPLWKTSNSL